MGNTISLRIVNEPQSINYKQILEKCLKNFPTSSIDNVHLANTLFSRIPKPFTQRIFSIFPEKISFETVVALVYIFMVSPRHTRACFIVDLYIGNKNQLTRDQVYRFFYDLTTETHSNIDITILLEDFVSQNKHKDYTDTDLIDYLTFHINIEKVKNLPIFKWIINGSKMPKKGYPLIEPERTVNDLLLMWDVTKPKISTLKHSKVTSKIISTYATIDSLCNFKERSIKELREIYYLLHPLKYTSKGIQIQTVISVFALSLNRSILVPLTTLIKNEKYNEFFIAITFTTKVSKNEKFQFIREILNPPKEGIVNKQFVTPIVESISLFYSVVYNSVGEFNLQNKIIEFIWEELKSLGEQFTYDTFEDTFSSNSNLYTLVDQLTQATTVLHGVLPKKLETEAQVFNALMSMYELNKMKPGEIVVLIPSSWFSKWTMMLNSSKREPLERINFNLLLDDKVAVTLKPTITERDIIPLHPEVFLVINSWYKHEGNVIERRLYYNQEKKRIDIELFPLKLYSFIHIRGELEIPSNTSHIEILLISRFASLRELHKLLCTKYKLPINKTRVLMFGKSNIPLVVSIDDGIEIYQYFKEESWVCLETLSVYSEIQNVNDGLTCIGTRGGEYGIFNEGNTSYISTVIQCLSHTPLIRDFFLSQSFKEDTTNGPLKNLANAFSNLLYNLWKPSNKPVIVSIKEFREVFINLTQQFNDKDQHDAMEYLTYLLGCLHESVNRNSGCGLPYLEIPNESLKIIAQNAWKEFNTLNQSIVTDSFTVMTKNKVQCTSCNHIRYLMNPSNIVLVPLPSEKFKVINFTVVPMNGQIPIKYSIKSTQERLLGDCLKELSLLCGLSLSHMLCADAPGSIILNILKDSTPIKNLTNGVKVFEVEKFPSIFPERKCLNSVITKSVKRQSTTNKMAYAPRQSMEVALRNSIKNTVIIPQTSLTPLRMKTEISKKGVVMINCLHRIVTENEVYFFNKYLTSVVSLPFILTYSYEELTVSNILRGILMHVRVALRQLVVQENKIFVDLPTTFNIEYLLSKGLEQLPFDLRVTSYDGKNCFDCPWDKDCCGCVLTDKILQQYDFNGFTFTVCIDWKSDSLIKYDQSIADLYLKDESFTDLRKLQTEPIQLVDCFKLLNLPDEFSIDDGWVCPHCQAICSATSVISLYSMPVYLIVNLKRFTQNGDKWIKSNIEVTFPIEGLKAKDIVDSSIETTEEDVYDLYAVINHIGKLNESHYTAICKVDKDKWLKFDDKSVSQVSSDSICTNTAYILFYQKRNANPEDVMNKYHFTDQKELLRQPCVIM
ncbi:ubiquitin specific protease, putative [Entamoeba dispar SAW760]|uniref:Ubiquitin specific protease, putative n=1 Tax=Entamoeba dispar (strain ATCC PRA-260 / SAW760) TaxID=370354 RepID=B0EH85_ENTDS|nr:ubiquitin specific protease, putative [Entamoeba dispar SAW760]EDR26078.1 ubiquitin specific protease, putative [Entamoeba dispar SAW760]|eukprot:EDR26078.1 ubiquitin specific protease, putative [Entamoeba dispar SAW760]